MQWMDNVSLCFWSPNISSYSLQLLAKLCFQHVSYIESPLSLIYLHEVRYEMCLIANSQTTQTNLSMSTFIASCVRTLSCQNEVKAWIWLIPRRAGHGTSQPPLPGTTQYTAGSSVVVSEVWHSHWHCHQINKLSSSLLQVWHQKIHCTPSLSAVFRSKKRTKLLHTSGACPGDGSYYYWCIRFLTGALLGYHIKLKDLQL